VPCGINTEAMPIGMQLIGSWFTDQTVLNMAFAYQSATDWHTRRPLLANA
jgi:aspartyl-tRNA(Asn)/glutamyl-tRNA(Gln) amidotransferase subunit A